MENYFDSELVCVCQVNRWHLQLSTNKNALAAGLRQCRKFSGALAYGTRTEEAIRNVQVLARRIVEDRIENKSKRNTEFHAERFQ